MAAVFAAAVTISIAGKAGAPALVITAYNGGAPFAYAGRKTPWGDPDLQDVWSSDDTGGIPLSRPQALSTQLYQDRRAVRRAPEVGRERRQERQWPVRHVQDFTLYDRCITRGIVGSVLRVVYGNGNRIVQTPGMVAISYEMIHDTRVFYTDGRPHLSPSIRQYLGDARAGRCRTVSASVASRSVKLVQADADAAGPASSQRTRAQARARSPHWESPSSTVESSGG